MSRGHHSWPRVSKRWFRFQLFPWCKTISLRPSPVNLRFPPPRESGSARPRGNSAQPASPAALLLPRRSPCQVASPRRRLVNTRFNRCQGKCSALSSCGTIRWFPSPRGSLVKSCPHCKSTYPTQFTVCPHDAVTLEEVSEMAPGTVLRGKYKILAKLGEGGMGAVYKAVHLRFDEVCALKVVLPAHLQDPTFLQRFQAEAVLMRRLDNPHALRVNDVDETEDGRPFFVMEFLEGQPLDALLAQGPLAVPRAVDIAMQACDALGVALRLGVVHRDIKPANMFLARAADGRDNVKVLDFGIAKVIAGSPLKDGASLTQTGALVGTPAY